MSASRKKRQPVCTETCDEDDTLRLAHLLKSIQRRAGGHFARTLVVRAFAFNGTDVIVNDARRVLSP